ncbi:hypothetical protein [Planomicrobium okeanokoites]
MKKSLLPATILAASILYIFFIPDNPLWFKLIFKLIPIVLIIMYALIRLPREKLKIHWLILT